jgi:D-alanine transaminase
VKLDDRPVGNGKPGRVFRRMYELYQEFKQTVMRAGKERAAA